MKLLLPSLAIVSLTLLSACSVRNQNAMSGASISAPHVNSEVDAHLALKNRVSGSATVETVQVLFMKFNVGGQESFVGNVGGLPHLKEGLPLNPIEILFKSPADRQAAVDAACFNAVENGNCDGLINTRVQVQSSGFSIFGLYGQGSASATIDAIGLNVSKGQIRSSSESRKTQSLLKGLLGNLLSEESSRPARPVAKAKSPTQDSVARKSPVFIQDQSGTSYLASAVPSHQGNL